MTSPAHYFRPPRIAAWLVNLFAPAEAAESIQGDLLEEFSALVSRLGVAAARSWYWRQTVRTITHLTCSAFRLAPWSTAAAVVLGFFLMQFGFRVEEIAIFAVLIRYRVFDHHFNLYLFFASTGIEIGRVILSMLVGCIVGLFAKGREMAATTMLSLILCSMAGTALFVLLARAQYFFLGMLPWQFAGWVAIAAGGAIVRTCRSATEPLPSNV